jgi:hypothetical protein
MVDTTDRIMYPHRIRLRGPWEAEPLDPPAASRRVTMPARFSECGLGECRAVRFRRRFGRPRQIDAEERVWLIGEGLTGSGDFCLNGERLGSHAAAAGPFAFPITNLLAERNELSIYVAADGPDGGLWGDVALEIRRRAWLSDVRTAPADGGRLCVSGEILGEADGPMDVYILAGGHSVGYRSCAAGHKFEIVTDEPVDAAGEMRVEMVGGAVVWYVVDLQSC